MITLGQRPGTRATTLVLAAIVLPLLAACGGDTPTVTPSTMPTSQPTTMATPGATATTGSGTGTSTGLAQDKASLTAALQQAGLTVAEEGSLEQPFLSIKGSTLKAGTEFVQVFEYADEAAAQSDASKISPDASIAGYRIDWLGPPHFYRSGRMLVVYPGNDQKLLTALESALGKPFAQAP